MLKTGHSLLARYLWNALFQGATNQKPFDGVFVPLQCPRAQCPFLNTRHNGVDCQSQLKRRFGSVR